MSEKRILITGSNGYIGSNIAKVFHNISWEVYGIDRVTNNINARRYHKELLKADYGDYAMMKKYLADVMPDVIVHCGGTSLVGPSVKNPDEYYTNNVVGTVNFLRAVIEVCRDKLPTILFSSSASVYGNPEVLPLTEDMKFNPMSPYGSSKAMIERILQDYYVAYGLRSVCFRYFNAAGASSDLGQAANATHIIARILESKINNTQFTLYGNDYNTEDGTCVRDYIHVEDIADAHLKAVVNHTPQGAEAYNLGTAKGISNKQIVDYVNEHIGELNVGTGPRRDGDPDILIADASNANKVLKWTPAKSNLETIVNDAWAWYKQLEAQKLENNVV